MPNDLWRCFVETPLGSAQVLSTGAGVLGLAFLQAGGPPDPRLDRSRKAASRSGDPHGMARRLLAWFKGDLDALDSVPMDLHGTPFQRRVWHRLRNLQPGLTSTYGDLAAQLGRPSAARAVGAAIGRNPVAVLVPCHRVIGVNGKLTGYAWGLSRKRWLLRHEGVLPEIRQVALFGT